MIKACIEAVKIPYSELNDIPGIEWSSSSNSPDQERSLEFAFEELEKVNFDFNKVKYH